MNQFEIHRFHGNEAQPLMKELASIRLKVFAEYPYLYEGSFHYEKKYLETYFKAERSFILMVKDKETGSWIGATTGIWAVEEEESFSAPFVRHGFELKEVFYFGESVLLPQYRGRGFGKLFFEERERFAKTIPSVKFISFCAVERENHPLKPKDYKPLDPFWINLGFKKEIGLVTSYEWKDLDEASPTKKNMQFWLKKI